MRTTSDCSVVSRPRSTRASRSVRPVTSSIRVRTNIRPIAMDHVELAKVGARTLARASRTDAASAATLTSLETWLRIKVPRQLDASSAREALNCVGCHSTKDRHVGLLGKDCAQCHVTTQWTIPEFRHPSSRSTNCAQCHQAPPSHYMMHFDMVSKKIARPGRCAGGRVLRRGSSEPVLPLPPDHVLERHPRRRLLQASLT